MRTECARLRQTGTGNAIKIQSVRRQRSGQQRGQCSKTGKTDIHNNCYPGSPFYHAADEHARPRVIVPPSCSCTARPFVRSEPLCRCACGVCLCVCMCVYVCGTDLLVHLIKTHADLHGLHPVETVTARQPKDTTTHVRVPRVMFACAQRPLYLRACPRAR